MSADDILGLRFPKTLQTKIFLVAEPCDAHDARPRISDETQRLKTFRRVHAHIRSSKPLITIEVPDPVCSTET